jgi:hypothetical protein
MYEVANPFALLARLITGGRSARMQPPEALRRVGYWPAVGLMFLLVWFELALRVVPSSPRGLGLLALGYIALQVGMGAAVGEGWYRGGDVFHAITSLASTIAPLALSRDDEGFVRLKVGFRRARFLPEAPGREALITLWLAGVLADGVRVTPIWTAITNGTASFVSSAGQVGSVDLGDLTLDTAEILFTWLAFGIFFWVFTTLAAGLSGRRPGEIAPVVSPSLIPIALAYLLAHNLSQLLVIAPLLVSGSADGAQAAAQLAANARGVSPGIVFAAQVCAIVLGHVIAVLMAHARLSRVERNSALAVRADLGWLAAMLIYTTTSLWVLAQPITNAG